MCNGAQLANTLRGKVTVFMELQLEVKHDYREHFPDDCAAYQRSRSKEFASCAHSD
jgi:hypothetical protein